MIQIEKTSIDHIPLLQVVQAKKADLALPTVIYFHGFYGEKENGLTIAYKIAENGFRVLLPDSHLHGERSNKLSQVELDLSFWDIVIRNIKELDVLKKYLTDEGLAIADRIGIGGTSMGGITTYGALKRHDWIKAAVVLMGTPKMTVFAKHLIDEFNEGNEKQISETEAEEAIQVLEAYDISLQPDRISDRPVFIWHGDKDAVVPFQHSVEFMEQAGSNERITFLPEKGCGHYVSKLAIKETATWFETYL